MRNARLLPAALVAGFLAVGLCAWRAGANSAAATARPTVVATIDLQKLINGLDELAAKQKEFDRFRDELKVKIEKKKKDLDDAEAALKVLVAGTPEQRAKVEDFRRLTLELKFEGEFASNLIDERRGVIYAAIFKKINETSARFAKQNGYDLILSDDTRAEVPDIGMENQIRALIVQRRVIFAGEAIDVTDAMLTTMNNEHKTGVNGK